MIHATHDPGHKNKLVFSLADCLHSIVKQNCFLHPATMQARPSKGRARIGEWVVSACWRGQGEGFEFYVRCEYDSPISIYETLRIHSKNFPLPPPVVSPYASGTPGVPMPTIKKSGSFQGKSNALGHGGRAAQMKAAGVPGGVIGAIARREGAAPGGPNYHGKKAKKGK